MLVVKVKNIFKNIIDMTDTAMRNHFLMDNLEIYVNLKFKSINSVIDKKFRYFELTP